jgi:hypothetical protein
MEDNRMNKHFWLTTTAAVLMATAALAQSGTKETPSAAPSAHQERSSERPDAASSPQAQSPSAASDTQSSQASRPATTPSADGASSEHGAAGRTNADRANTERPSKATTSDNASDKQKEGDAAREDARPNSERAQSREPASGQRQSNNPDGAADRSRQSTAKDAAAPDRRDARSPNEDGRRNAEGASDRGRTDASSAKIDDRQRTRVSESVSRLNVRPLNDVKFSVSVGTTVPRDVRLERLPADVVEIVPQYRDYDFVVVRDEIVIVDPSSYRIVASLPYSGRSAAATTAPRERRQVAFSDRDREAVRKHVRTVPVKRQTTGSAVRTEIRTGEPVPEGVEIEAFPEEVYRDAPDLREYRYIHRDTRTYIVEPEDRRVIEEID